MGIDRRTAAGFPLVALAAALWGTDALFRRGLALELPATTVVFYEHLVLTLLMLPVLMRIPWRRLSRADVGCLVLIGAGASALATGLFTASFRYGDPNAPLLLQQIQPFVAVLGARLLLGERFRRRFGLWFTGGVAAAWLIAFPDPLQIRIEQALPGLLAAAAAVLWGMGTVLGRRMSATLSFSQLTAVRFGIGLLAALLFASLGPGRPDSLAIATGDVSALLLLALIPGLLALLLYYRGLRRTPAGAATLAELAFPVAAISINFVAFDATLKPTQMVGVFVLSATLVAMSIAGRHHSASLGVEQVEAVHPATAVRLVPSPRG